MSLPPHIPVSPFFVVRLGSFAPLRETASGMTLNPSSKESKRLGILISGRGSNMVALAEAAREDRIPNAEIVLVISDKPEVAGLESAKTLGLNTLVIERRGRTREEHDRETVAALKEHEVDLVCLAGYLRLLSSYFINAYRNRILNIHPSLLPCFPGLDAQRQAIAHGVKWSGCTVHFVDETLDGGPIIAQRIVPVLDGDTEESLSDRILEQEHLLYAEAVALVVSGNYEIVGRRVIRKNVTQAVSLRRRWNAAPGTRKPGVALQFALLAFPPSASAR